MRFAGVTKLSRNRRKKTLEYRRLRESVFELDRDLKLLQWHQLGASREKKTLRLEKKSATHAAVVVQIDQIKADLAGELGRVNQMESRLIECQKQLYGMDLEKENREEQIRSIGERRNETEEAMKVSGAREKNALEAMKALNQLKTRRKSDLSGFRDRLKEIQARIVSCRKTVKSAEDRIKGNSDETAETETALAVQEKLREGLQDDLRALTDIIVTQLDRHLRESGYDRGPRRSMEESIVGKLGELRVRAEGRSRLLGDRKNLSDSKAALTLLESAAFDLECIVSSLEELSSLFDEYRASGAHFLEDFLAPEGIITRKRELDERIAASAQKTRELKNRIAVLVEEKEVLNARIQESRKSLEELRVAQARITTQAAAAEDSLASLDREAESEEARLVEIRHQIAAEESKVRNLDDQSAAAMAKREDLDRKQEKLRINMAGLETEINTQNEKMAGREDRLKNCTEQRASLELDREKIRLELGHLDDEEKQLLEDFRDRNSRDLTEFAERKSEIDSAPRDIRKKLSAVKTDLKGLGRVNLMAPEQFAEVSERYEFLNGQLEDLIKAKEDLSRVTEEIRRESGALFLKTYKEIRDHFHEMFRRLFGGGRAEIRLVDHGDPLNSGLEIYAQPPGKKLENISLLSGGEKSLCGVALMFATFLVKPSPFCILDEIDAALDEANIQRFVNVLVEFGRFSQFVVITHNKKTVTGARNLLGVTMQESGISHLITLRLDGEQQVADDEEPVAAGR